MVSIKINKSQLLKDLGVQESEHMLEQIVMMGVEIDENTKEELIVDITPNRPDMLSQAGFTRALAAFLGIRSGLIAYNTTPSKLKVFVDDSVKSIRPYTACAVAKNLKLTDEKLKEIIDIQEKLHTTFCRRRKKAAIGIYPMEAISGNITYLALPADKIKFLPLESTKEMTAKEILEEHPKGKEFAHLVKDLPMYALFQDNKKKILSMPPIINSHDTGKVTLDTKEVFIECSGFDFRICHEIIQIISAALADMGASIQTVEVVYGRKSEITPDMSPKRQEFYGYYVNKRLGTNFTKEQLVPLLAKMGLGFEDGRIKDTYFALLPAYRVDFLHQVDVVEDIAIANGYDNIKAVLPNVVTIAGETNTAKFDKILRKTLIGYNLLEAKNYHLVNKELQQAINPQGEYTLVRSSVSEEYNSLRESLLPGILLMISRNKLYEYPQSFFEMGTVFSPAPDHVEETEHLAIALAGADVDYTKIRQQVDGLVRALGLSGTYQEHQDMKFIPGRCAALIVDGVRIGILGELHPRVITQGSVTVPIAYSEIDVDVLRLIRLAR